MSLETATGPTSSHTILQDAAGKHADITISIATDGGWANLRSSLMGFDPGQDILKIAYPLMRDHHATLEIVPGDSLGVSFRRGHKKCLFVSTVVVRQQDPINGGQSIDTLILKAPTHIRELQRRVYQRVAVAPGRFIAVKLWEGGVPQEGTVAWPLCAGRVANLSVGGVLMMIRPDHNPRLSAGDIVGVEITSRPGSPPILVDAQFRHCSIEGDHKLFLGFQFLGLEHDVPGRSSITELVEFVRTLRRIPMPR